MLFSGLSFYNMEIFKLDGRNDPEAANDDSFHEYAWVDVNPEGNVWAEYEFGGPMVQLGGANFNDLETMFPNFFQVFRWSNWEFDYSPNPQDQNSFIQVTFQTANHEDARDYAEWMMGFVNAFIVGQYYEQGVYSWDDWDGDQWKSFTTIEYGMHVDWPVLMEDYNALIPRDLGGLAETLNISSADRLRWWLWNGGDGIYQSCGAAWSSQADKLDGGFLFNFTNYIPVTKIQKAPQQDGPLRVDFRLPDVTLTGYTANAWNETHGDNRETWNKHHYYEIILDVQDGDSYTEFWTSFNYTFMPLDKYPIESAHVDVNPYGYAYKNIEIRHDNSSFYNWVDEVGDIEELLEMRVTYLKNTSWSNDTISVVNLYLENTRSFESNITDLRDWIDVNLVDWTYLGNHTQFEWNYGSDRNDNDVIKWVLFYNTSYTPANWDTLWNTTWIYNQSQMMQNSDLISATGISEVYQKRFHIEEYWTNYIEIQMNPLNYLIANPIKLFDESGGQTHNINIANLFGWENISVSEGFYATNIDLDIPTLSDRNSVRVNNPAQNNGYGFNFGYWGYYRNEQYANLHFRMYTNDAHYWNETLGENISVTTFDLDFDYGFHTDSDDLIAPNGDIGWYNYTTFEPVLQYDEKFWDKWSYSEEERITARVYDDGSLNWWDEAYYNGTENGDDDVPRFYQSGIDSVYLDLFWSDLPIYHDDFHWEYSMTLNNSEPEVEDYWYYDLDTTLLADGMYTINGWANDTAGNAGGRTMFIEVDNFNDTFTIKPTIDWIGDTPVNNSLVSGTVQVQVNLTDDIGVFAAVFTLDNTEYVFDDSFKESEGVYQFEWNTLQEREGSVHLITIELWDMEGHKTTEYYTYEVDNIPLGEAPIIEFVSPSEAGLLLEGLYIFEFNVTDDVGISAVSAKIDDRTFNDVYMNLSTGLYEYQYNVSSLTNGTHSLTVQVIDLDENQHITPVSIEFWVNTSIEAGIVSDPPEYKNLLPGNFSSAADIMSGNIQFSLDIFDDTGIESVQIKISTVTGVDPSEISTPEGIELNDIRILEGYPKSMMQEGNTTDWLTYTDTWNSTQSPNGLYLVEIEVGDNDITQNVLHIRMLIIINNENVDGDPFGNIPGFSLEYLLGALLISIGLIAHKSHRI